MAAASSSIDKRREATAIAYPRSSRRALCDEYSRIDARVLMMGGRTRRCCLFTRSVCGKRGRGRGSAARFKGKEGGRTVGFFMPLLRKMLPYGCIWCAWVARQFSIYRRRKYFEAV